MKYLKNLLMGVMRLWPCDGEGGAAGGNDGGASGKDPAFSPELIDKLGIDIHPDLMDDGALAADLAALVAEEEGKSGKGEDDKGDKSGKGEDDKGDKSGKGEDDKGDKSGEEEITIEIENDIDINGVIFPKDEVSKLSPEAIENLGKLKVALDEGNTKLSDIQKWVKAITGDPVITDRLERIKAGKAKEEYATAGMSKETHDAFVKAFTDIELSAEVAESIFEKVHEEIKEDIKFNVQNALKNNLIFYDSKIQNDKINEQGVALVEELAGLNDKLTKELVYEWCTSSERQGSGKQGGLTYGDLLKMKTSVGIEAIYTAIAKKYDLPVAINTKERDKEIANKERSKYLDAIGAKSVSKMLGDKRSSGKDGKDGQGTIDNKGGNKKATKEQLEDYDFISEALDKATSDEDLFRIQEELLAQDK